MTVTGIEHCQFVNKKGEEVRFDRITLYRDIPADRGEGQAAEVITCSTEKSAGLELGDEVEVLYNRYGKVVMFDILDKR